jgi:hypothetical protein
MKCSKQNQIWQILKTVSLYSESVWAYDIILDLYISFLKNYYDISQMLTNLIRISLLGISVMWAQYAWNKSNSHYFTVHILHQIWCKLRFDSHPCEFCISVVTGHMTWKSEIHLLSTVKTKNGIQISFEMVSISL